ncbi:MAG: hypothetical protein EPO01_13550 [Aquabacterium sp.]|nr:MAG: hypothetical protein EPO01_13550 [Aquabacterium sp.]
MSTLMIGAAAVAFVLPLLLARRRRPRAGSCPHRAIAGTQPWQLPLLRGGEVVAATGTAAEVQGLLARLPRHEGLQRSCTATLHALADYVQLLPGARDPAYGGLWRECLAGAARALDWPRCDKPACPKQPQAESWHGEAPVQAALLAGLLTPLRDGLQASEVLLQARDVSRPWVAILGPMRRNVWGAERYTVQRSEALGPDRRELYLRAPAAALDFVLDPLAAEHLRRDATLHAELMDFLRAERETRFDRMQQDPGLDCSCFESPQRGAQDAAQAATPALQPVALALRPEAPRR